ncbi:hypothetical protein MU582_03390 [Nocardioidaceae bacterium SCSIO 66511]|nr:hypothetical protein MU582_03390 [Nocardioidaceae bacterium SCSIO 66511]
MGRRRPMYAPPPRFTRHVWVATDRGQEPEQGFVLEWRRHAYKWSALVVLVRSDDTNRAVFVQRWLSAEHLAPVRTSPTTPEAHDGF